MFELGGARFVRVRWTELVRWRRSARHDVLAPRNKAPPCALIGFDLRQMEGDVSGELLEERYPIANQDRQDRITNFVG